VVPLTAQVVVLVMVAPTKARMVVPVVVPVIVVSETARMLVPVVFPVVVVPEKARIVVTVVVPVNASVVLGSRYASPLFYKVVMLFLSKMRSNPISSGICSNGHICSGKHTTIESKHSDPHLAKEVTCKRSVNKCNTGRFHLPQLSASVHTHDDEFKYPKPCSNAIRKNILIWDSGETVCVTGDKAAFPDGV